MELETATISRVTRRLVPLLILAYLTAYLDRVNVSFAALRMNADLGLSSAAYGFGAGIFFLLYLVLEVPSNIILERVGARRWIARIMVTWGVISCGTAFVRGEHSFYLARALLGGAEAGFFPGVVYYLSLWYPANQRARIASYFMVAIPLSTVVGAPLSGVILGFDSVLGLHGWQWLFILEGLPSIALGIVVLFCLTDGPAAAAWLDPDQRAWLLRRLAAERAAGESTRRQGIVSALRSPISLALGLVCFGAVVTNYGVSFFLPQIVAGFGWSMRATGLVSALPYVVGTVGMLWWGRRSDITGERKLHTAAAIAIASGSLAISTLFAAPLPKMIAISIAGFGMFAYLGPFWSIPALFLRGPGLAAGIALINSIANLAGFMGPYIIGYVRNATGSFRGGLLAVSALGAIAMLILLTLPIRRQAPHGDPVVPQAARS